VLAALLLLSMLPSALNLPQSTPSETLEYAPVPPDDQNQTNLSGNFSSLGLGRSSAFGAAAGNDPTDTGGTAGGGSTGKNPATKRCVGNPPRQTEDPMSPPCVAYFSGDNGGATYQGVTRDEITVLMVLQWGWGLRPGAGGRNGTYCDVDLGYPASPGCEGVEYNDVTPNDPRSTGREAGLSRVVKALSVHFNERFQTYGRHVHFWIHWSEFEDSPERRRANASENFTRIEPFAVIDRENFNGGGNKAAYSQVMARFGVINVQATGPELESYFRTFPGFLWNFSPSIERLARTYVDYVCTRVAPFPVSHSTNGTGPDGEPMNGRPRRYGLFISDDEGKPQYRVLSDLVRDGLADCGVKPVIELSNNNEGGFPTETDTVNAATFSQNGVTTVLWLAGYLFYQSRAFAAQNYYPEIVVAGDGEVDRGTEAGLQDQSVWQNAWLVTPYQLREDSPDSTQGFHACRGADPAIPRDDATSFCEALYRDLFLLFLMIQSAGPRLSPETVERGLRAIPPVVSTDPYKASCYFELGDYTCVKDAIEEWWDPGGEARPDSTPGCWRMTRGGQRFVIGDWPRADEVFDNPADPCNSAASAPPSA
jgi:hypothetical protein